MNTVSPRVAPEIPTAVPNWVAIENAIDDLEEMFVYDEEAEAAKERILVMAHLPHLKDYGHDPNRELVYRWAGGPIEVGDLVECPPTPLRPKPFTAIVTSLDASRHPYKGPVKTISKKVEKGGESGHGAKGNNS